jgi:hypothetical protein
MSQLPKVIRNKDLYMSNPFIKFISLNTTAALLAVSEASASASYTVKTNMGGTFYESCDNRAFGEGLAGDYETTEILDTPISEKENKAFERLSNVWGDDEDGVYERHYRRLVKKKVHVL